MTTYYTYCAHTPTEQELSSTSYLLENKQEIEDGFKKLDEDWKKFQEDELTNDVAHPKIKFYDLV